MNTKNVTAAPAGGGLAEVLAVLDAARQGTADPHDLYCARLAIAELIEASSAYFTDYCRDEAEDVFEDGEVHGYNTGCTHEQAEAAQRLRAALAKVASNGDTK